MCVPCIPPTQAYQKTCQATLVNRGYVLSAIRSWVQEVLRDYIEHSWGTSEYDLSNSLEEFIFR